MILSYKVFENDINVPKIGELVVCDGNIDEVKTHNHIGILRKGGVEFLNRFSDKLHDLGGEAPNRNGWFVANLNWLKSFNNNQVGNNIPLLYSQKLKDVLSYSLKFLIDYEHIYFSNVSYVDATNRNDTISCLSDTNFHKLEKNEDPWTSTMRQNMRVGRFIKEIISGPESLIANYINEYKFSFNLDRSELSKFKITKGIAMAKWYLAMYYAPGGGILNQSCMKHLKSQYRLPIYTNNPEKIKLLYMLNNDGKLIGRALLWKLSEPKNMIYMDRIYTTEDYIEKLFLNYAKKKGYITKQDAEKEGLVMRVKLDMDYGSPQNNPFMDTFKFFVKDGYYLTNKFNNLKPGEYWEYVNHD